MHFNFSQNFSQDCHIPPPYFTTSPTKCVFYGSTIVAGHWIREAIFFSNRRNSKIKVRVHINPILVPKEIFI